MDERIRTVLNVLLTQPRNIRAYLEQPGPDFAKAPSDQVELMLDLFLSEDTNREERLAFSNILHAWDNTREAHWTNSTPRNTAERRKRIHELLLSDPVLQNRIDHLLPFYHLDEPVIILDQPRDWYSPEHGVRDYYWSTYTRYLRERNRWSDVAILSLDNSTRAILECLANPESKEVYASRGLVMGYVQSGKTANFAGVIARAADAGYRLIVVLAGTWNILRHQTQRRLDKELLGKEFLQNDETYMNSPPEDWDEFLEHGFNPWEQGHYRWHRLTHPDIDYRRLRAAISDLEFERLNTSRPLYDASNLHALPVKLLVIKKNPTILRHLTRDLRLVSNQLAQLPSLVIDDESDQAGINTLDPRRRVAGQRNRTATNDAIVELLGLLPRCQYVGYTATPYANALVDPDDPEDLFPQDFIVSLDRPAEYMGVTDFFDPECEYEDLPKGDYSHPEIAFVRRVESPEAGDDEDLMRALRSYVLAGAVKLFRQAQNAVRYNFKHHTMLVHTSARTAQHANIMERVRELWDRCAFNSPGGLNALRKLWNEDYQPVCEAQGKKEENCTAFEQLGPHLSDCIAKVSQSMRFILVVNSDSPDAPDFTRDSVWKIIVGGNKLSRGYTIEGLTVSYYRRVTNTGDTLIQMGRWFGFRPGYRDLVRVFIGVREGRRADIDLAALFRQACVMEERFREEIKRYAHLEGAERITPKEIPPLISVIGNLPPTSRNKMFNARVASRNYGGRWSQPTLTASESEGIRKNISALKRLILNSTPLNFVELGGREGNGNNSRARSFLFEVGNTDVQSFMNDFHWLESAFRYPDRPDDINLQMEFLTRSGNSIDSWLIVAPQRRDSFGNPLDLGITGISPLAVKERHRVEGRGFQQFGEPANRAIAEYLAGLDQSERRHLAIPNSETSLLRNLHRGILLLYPTRESVADGVSVGFEMLYPGNNLAQQIGFTVRRRDGGIIVPVTGDET